MGVENIRLLDKNVTLKELKTLSLIEKEAFGEYAALNEWTLKPLIKYGKVFVLELKNKIIGVVEMIFSLEKTAHILNFSIFKKHQNKGFGTNFLKTVIYEIEKSYEITVWELTCDPKNDKALSVYKKIGFEISDNLLNEYGKGINRFLLKKFCK